MHTKRERERIQVQLVGSEQESPATRLAVQGCSLVSETTRTRESSEGPSPLKCHAR